MTNKLFTPKLREAHTNKKRFFEIDVIRGVAILLVVFYHLILDLNYFGFTSFDLFSGFWLYFQRIAASLFVLIFGICITIAAQQPDYESRFLKRGAKLAGVALLITAATWVYPHDGFIFFGVMHFFAASIILSMLFLRFKEKNLLLGILLVVVGLYVNTFYSSNPLLIPFGIFTYNTFTLDYFPLLPWFGVVLIGMAIGRYAYIENKARVKIKENKATKMLSFLGKHTLAIYLTHQIVIVFLLLLLQTLF